MDKPVMSRITNVFVNNPLLVLLIGMVLLVQIITGSQLNWQNLRGVLLDVSVIAIVAVPCAMIIIAGNIDLSVGSTLALGGVTAGLFLKSGVDAPVAMLGAVLIGAAVGAVNGFLIAFARLSPFIVTLGMLTVVRGIAQLISPYASSGFEASFTVLGLGAVNGVPIPVIVAVGVVLVAALFLTLTPAGRHVYAVGVNQEAAYLSGIRVRTIPFLLYIASGACAALTGMILIARLNSAPAGQLGIGFELSVLTAVLLGGVALTGGEGGTFSVVIGVLFLGLLSNSLVLLGVTSFWQNVASGVALIAAIAISAGTHRLRQALLSAQASRLGAREKKRLV